jgi:hypothetical protein
MQESTRSEGLHIHENTKGPDSLDPDRLAQQDDQGKQEVALWI